MVALKFKSLRTREEGYLLFESLLTIIILMIIATVLCPLAINWLSKHHEGKRLVEENRQLYEASILLNTKQSPPFEEGISTIRLDEHHLKISGTETEVIIYESVFKK